MGLRGISALLTAIMLSGCVTAQEREQGDAMRELGLAQMTEGDATGALGTLLKARDLDPKNANTQHELGMAYFAKGLVVEAEACMTKALKLEPGLSEARLNLSSVYLSTGRYEEAIAVLQEAVADPLYRRTYRAYNNLGVAYEGVGKSDEALRAYGRAVQFAPTFCLANYNLARLEDQQGDLKSALGHYERATENCPEIHQYELDYGWTLARTGHESEAVMHLTRVSQTAKSEAVAQKALEYLRVME